MAEPIIIQGGMGVGVSGWKLASAVASQGYLGVVSGTALDVVLARRLQLGDLGGQLRRAIAAFPFPAIARRVLGRYFVEGGKSETQPFKTVPLFSINPCRDLVELTVLANFTEVFLAKEGHGGMVGMNYLEKIQLPTLHSIFGAMLAGVDYILMGAGIPRAIPGILDGLADGEPVSMKLDAGPSGDAPPVMMTLNPDEVVEGNISGLRRPKFLAIISSAALAMTLALKSSGRVDGFIVEGASAGGHNAPPRGKMLLSEKGEPIYTDRDRPDLEKICSLGLPFWLAGSYGTPGKLKEAHALGATGIQAGTCFAFCEESGIDPDLKRRVVKAAVAGEADVFTDPLASPTGFPFKIVKMEGTLSDEKLRTERKRVCDLGYLRQVYRKEDGSVGYRCPGEPVDAYVKKGGKIEDTVGRACVCNGLLATAGYAQVRGPAAEAELPLLTAGDDLNRIAEFVQPGGDSYTAVDVLTRLSQG